MDIAGNRDTSYMMNYSLSRGISFFLKMFADTNILLLMYFIRFHAIYDRRNLMEYLSTAEVAKKWGITARRVQIL